jgi:RNA polymerase sigma-70 factor (ECF subfamily)
METGSSHLSSLREPEVPFESLRQDPKAWTREVYEYLYGPALNQAKRTLGNWASKHAEDVAITSITKLMLKLPKETQFQNYIGLRNFVVHIAADVSIDLIRKESAKKRKASDDEVVGEDEFMELPSDEPTPYDYAAVSDRAKIIHEILKTLKPKQKAILFDFFLGGLKHREIAEKHGLPIGSVGGYLNEGLRELKECIGLKPALMGELQALTCISFMFLTTF